MSNNNEGQMRLDALNILGLTENQDNEKEIRQAYLLKSRIVVSYLGVDVG